jgi:hypothetical protein
MPEKKCRSRKQLEHDLLATQLTERRIAVARQAIKAAATNLLAKRLARLTRLDDPAPATVKDLRNPPLPASAMPLTTTTSR